MRILKIMTAFLILILVLFPISLGSSIPPKDVEVHLKALKMDIMIQHELANVKAIEDAYKLDESIKEGSKITKQVLDELPLLDLYFIDKEYAKKKFYNMRRSQRNKEIDIAIDYFSNRYGVDPNLVKAMVKAESHFNPRARSNKNAKGLMQLMHFTAKKYGVEDRYHPFENLEGGIRYLKHLLIEFKGNEDFAIAAYNAGPQRIRQYKGIPPFKETRDYLKKVKKFKREFYGIETHVATLSDSWNWNWKELVAEGSIDDSWSRTLIAKV